MFFLEQRGVYESLKIALAIYQITDTKILPLIVSDGFCQMAQESRGSLIRKLYKNTYGMVHPEDVQGLERNVDRFIHHGGLYNVIYRRKMSSQDTYHVFHSFGVMHTVHGDDKVSFILYTDLTAHRGEYHNYLYQLKKQQGMAVWNLAHRESFVETLGKSLDFLRDCTDLEVFLDRLMEHCSDPEDFAIVQCCRKKVTHNPNQYMDQNVWKSITLDLMEEKYQVNLELDVCTEGGDESLKITIDTVTEYALISQLLMEVVEGSLRMAARVDVTSGECLMVNVENERLNIHKFHLEEEDLPEADFLRSMLKEMLGEALQEPERIAARMEQKKDSMRELFVVKQLTDRHTKKLDVEYAGHIGRVLLLRYSDQLGLGTRHGEWEQVQKTSQVLDANIMLQRAVLKEREKIESILVQTILAVSRALDAKDTYTRKHSERVAVYASALAKKLGWGEKRVQDIYNIGLVHDIGKIGIPDEVLLKSSALTRNEYEMIKEHVLIGSDILKDFQGIDGMYEGILYHHERYDGDGYLHRLKGEEIPIEARIICVADSVDAMYSTRPYREKQSVEYIIQELEKGRGSQFDPFLADLFLGLIREGILDRHR